VKPAQLYQENAASMMTRIGANPLFACALYTVAAVMWLIPDRRIEKRLAESLS
jgi:hypothetical protein